MKPKQKPKQIARRLNDIGPHSNKNKVEGLARSVAQRIKHGEAPPPGYASWHYVIMQFYRPMKEELNELKRQLRKLAA
jgi:hypothetical protein